MSNGKKAKVKLKLNEKNIPEKLSYGKNVINLLSTDPVFSPLADGIAIAKAALANLEASRGKRDAAESALRSAVEEMQRRNDEFDQVFTELGNDVNSIAKGDKNIIDKSGLESFFPGRTEPARDMPQVLSLSASQGDRDGEIDLQWEPVRGVSSYIVEWSEGENGSWVFAGTSTRSKYTLAELNSGTRYRFRVSAAGSNGQGPFSEPVSKIAP